MPSQLRNNMLTTALVVALLPSSGQAFSSSGIRTTRIEKRSRTMTRPKNFPGPQTLQELPLTPFISIRNRRSVALGASTNDSSQSKDSPLEKALEARNLRKAVSVFQGNQAENLDLSRDQWNQIFEMIEERTTNAEENTANMQEMTEFPAQSAARSEMTEMYKALKQSGKLQLYGALDTRLPLAAGSSSVPPPLLESILDLPMKALTPQPTNSLLLAGAAVAVIEGMISVGLNIPLDTMVLSTFFIVTLDRLILNGASFETLLKIFSPGVQDKILRHEAGHFLAAYLLGCPVEGIVLSAWAALKDKRFGTRQVSAGTSFFDPELSQQINTRQSVTRSVVDRYSIIVMAGIAAEADNYGKADGGAGDEMALVAFLSQLNANSAKASWSPDTIRNQARWGALQAVLLLREYKPSYDALVDALERGGTLGDCIYAIEKAARTHGLGPVKHPLGYIVEETSQEKDSLTVQNNVVWEEYKEEINKPVATEQESASSVALVNGNEEESSAKVEVPAEQMDEESMSTTLQQYRAQVEEKLRDVEQRLNELN